MTELAESLRRVYRLPHDMVPCLGFNFLDLWTSQEGTLSLYAKNARADLLDLATSFRGENNSWGLLRLLERWVNKQPWRRAMPATFQLQLTSAPCACSKCCHVIWEPSQASTHAVSQLRSTRMLMARQPDMSIITCFYLTRYLPPCMSLAMQTFCTRMRRKLLGVIYSNHA